MNDELNRNQRKEPMEDQASKLVELAREKHAAKLAQQQAVNAQCRARIVADAAKRDSLHVFAHHLTADGLALYETDR